MATDAEIVEAGLEFLEVDEAVTDAIAGDEHFRYDLCVVWLDAKKRLLDLLRDRREALETTAGTSPPSPDSPS